MTRRIPLPDGAAEFISNESLCKTFLTALLLAGSAKQAEASVVKGIQWLDDPIEPTPQAILHGTVVAALEQTTDLKRHQSEEVEHSSSMLPDELQRVLRLSPYLRRCFVLRCLIALPSESCARLLHLKPQEVDENACIAARALARIEQQEKAA